MVEVITLIQGDDLGLDFQMHGGEEVIEIQEVVFSCAEQGIIKRCTKIDDDLYCLAISSEETSKFIPKMSSFDITLRFFDGKIVTTIFQNRLQILRKRNKIERT